MFSNEALIAQGDYVILYVSRDSVDCVQVDSANSYTCKHGYFPHSEIIGKPFGSQIISKNKKGFIYALRPTPELWTLALPHRTQILYHPDISFITSSLDVRPGSKVAEAGTGSGSFTHSLARTVGSQGKIYSFEYHEERCEKARAEFESHGLLPTVHLQHRDVVKDGFGLTDEVDAVFLDLPTPESAIAAAKGALRKDRVTRICCFSPCIEQVIKTVAELNKQGFSDIQMYETLVRNYDVVNTTLPPISSAVDRISQVEKKKAARRGMQMAAAAAKRAEKEAVTQNGATAEDEEDAAMAEDGVESAGNVVPSKRPAEANGHNGTPPAKRPHLDTPPRAATNKAAALQRALREGDVVNAARPLHQNLAGLQKTVSGLVDIPSQDVQKLTENVSFGSTPNLTAEAS